MEKVTEVRENCLVCGARLHKKPLISLNRMPSSAQDIPTKEELEIDEGIHLNLRQCSGCGLIQFDCNPVSYYRDVIRSGGFSTTMVELRKKQYKKFISTCKLNGKKIVEVGCGQGEFLSVLDEFDVGAYGIENKIELVKLAREKGLNVDQQFMLDGTTRLKEAPYDAFLSFNFFEHQPDPNGMLQGIYNNLTEDGVGLITVPSLEYILEHNGYYELIRDHLVYYTFDTLEFVLNKNGFEVISKEVVNRDTLSVIVRKRRMIDVSKLVDSFKTINAEVHSYIDIIRNKGGKIAIWGASHQGFTLASTLSLGDSIECIIDSAPFKQGKYAPASHIPIISPELAKTKELDAIIIMAPGYTKEIAEIIQEEFNKDIDIMVMMTNHLQTYEDAMA